MSATLRDNWQVMGGAGLRKPYPTGPKKQVTVEWKQRVRDRLNELGHDHRWLEAQLIGKDGAGASRGMVTKLLSGKQHTSALVDLICEVLGLDAPVAEINDPDEFALLDGFRRMPAEQRKHLLGLIALAPPRKK